MTGREQWFHFGPWAFSINTAQALIDAAPREPLALDVETWAIAYGLNQLDDPHRTTVNLIGPAPDAIDRLYALSTDLTRPVLLGQLSVNGGPAAPLLIDGVHRLYHAWHDRTPALPAYLLTAVETRRIQHDRLLGPSGTTIRPPRA